ncbi:uncharacterized protein M6B38_393230 [Iris pallida]|uniref:Ribosome-recycling factor, chloroplastic n=1 Tax=Iris pallida TaxID=29817 RepID=A0AAX6FXW1_IRIPA|nr:uncharacterized protein M6B38_393230 [Iris pallida]
MATLLRRALPKGLLLLRSPRRLGTLSRLSSLVAVEPVRGAPAVGFRPRPDLLVGNRRGFAKGKKSKNEDDDDTIQVPPDFGQNLKSTALSQMEAAIDALSRELSKLRTGRASAGMLDHIIVETSGGKMPLNRVAVVSVMDSHTLSVTPYDPNALKSIEQAIVSSPLGVNPTADGDRLIAPIPPLTKENIQALCKVVAKCAEDGKQSIRRARQKSLDSIKKVSAGISKDAAKKLEKEVDEITKRFVKSADDMCKAKEKEISGR